MCKASVPRVPTVVCFSVSKSLSPCRHLNSSCPLNWNSVVKSNLEILHCKEGHYTVDRNLKTKKKNPISTGDIIPKGKQTLVEQSETWLALWCLHCCLLMDHHKGSKRALTLLSRLSWESSECAFFICCSQVNELTSPLDVEDFVTKQSLIKCCLAPLS
jgi:hypothetical protein